MFLKPILIIIVIVSAFLLFKKTPNQQTIPKVDITIKDKRFSLEIARSTSQKSRGLSNRDNLCPTCGMIFVYQTESIYPFWMKNTLIPLDIIWISKQGTVVDIIQGKPKDLSVLTPKAKALNIIELNLDTSTNLNLQIGDHIQIPSNL